jgi:hypothetical protein
MSDQILKKLRLQRPNIEKDEAAQEMRRQTKLLICVTKLYRGWPKINNVVGIIKLACKV